ncbi:hypothetical protein HGRIS_004885 [Hohenbuehelia grisea]|uniref:Uncharacterized protein n=1 Tax=Hohenbuehelia grisea TaxID=104357 RepID=A0ABR3JDA5_9AGAR
MPAVDITSPTAPPTFNTTALLIAFGVGLGVLGACGLLYKSLLLLLDWMDTKIEEKADLELTRARHFTVDLRLPEAALLSRQYAPDIPDVGPLRPIIPPYLSVLPLPPPVYSGEVFCSPYTFPDVSVNSSAYSFESISISSSSSMTPLDSVDQVVNAPLESPLIAYEEPSMVTEEEMEEGEDVFIKPVFHQSLENSDSGADLAAILARIEELESVREPFAPIFKNDSVSAMALTARQSDAPTKNGEITPDKTSKRGGSIKIIRQAAKTSKRRFSASSRNENKENTRRPSSYMSPTAASRIRASDMGFVRPARRNL